MRKILKSENGMTRLTLLLLIIAFLSLAGALGFTYYNKTQENSQVASTTETNQNESRVVNDSKNETSKSSKKSTSNGDWTQDKTEVSSGDVTLEVGSKVTGYEANGIDEWYVLGAEDGKLLITTTECDEEIELSGKDGYENGIEILNNAVQDYSDGDLAESVRSINVDDINRVTGYNPEEGDFYVTDYGKEYTYEDKGTFYDGEKWVTLEEGEKIKLSYNYYVYSLGSKIDLKSSAYKLLTGIDIWLASQFVYCYPGGVNFRLGILVDDGTFMSRILAKSDGSEYTECYSIIPVVSLKSEVKINSDGEISGESENEKSKTQNAETKNTAKTTNTSNTSKNETSKSSKKSTSKGNWTQDKTEVTNGDVTLEVGSEVKGYEANGIDEWYVLGVEDGKLLITTNKGDEKVELSGKDGYENGIEILNNAVQDIYDDGNLAESVRSINVDDINRVTGYNPEDEEDYGKEYTYEDEGTFYDGEKWVTLEEGEKINILKSSYGYSIGSKIDKDSSAFGLLSGKRYWLGSQYVYCGSYYVNFGLRDVYADGYVNYYNLANSNGDEGNYYFGVLPVVSLKSGVKITSNGELSMD